MNFRLVWIDRALAELTVVYLLALDTGHGDDVVHAAARIDGLLEGNPLSVGESRAGHERVVFESPLTVYFEVHEDEQAVVVTSVRYRRRQ
jgi:hypothetical protein